MNRRLRRQKLHDSRQTFVQLTHIRKVGLKIEDWSPRGGSNSQLSGSDDRRAINFYL